MASGLIVKVRRVDPETMQFVGAPPGSVRWAVDAWRDGSWIGTKIADTQKEAKALAAEIRKKGSLR